MDNITSDGQYCDVIRDKFPPEINVNGNVLTPERLVINVDAMGLMTYKLLVYRLLRNWLRTCPRTSIKSV